MIPENIKYVMGLWRSIVNNHGLMFETMERNDFEAEAKSLPVAGAQKKDHSDEGEGNESGEDDEAEENYGLFRNMAAKSVRAHYRAIIGSKNIKMDEGGGEGGNRDSEVFQYDSVPRQIVHLAHDCSEMYAGG